jgi:hypothetical protein
MNDAQPCLPTPLLDAFLGFFDAWSPAFCQKRTFLRAIRLALAHVLTPGHRMISRLISSCGREQRDWSADYKLFNRSPWKAEKLFAPALEACLKHTEEQDFIHVAGDMTHVRKTGKKVAGVHCMRDPMSPPFHVNLIYGLRFLQMTCVLPLYRKNAEASPRSVPVFFQEVPALAKPGKKATEEEKEAFIRAKKKPRGMIQTVNSLKTLRGQFDEQGCRKVILLTLDGGFCNRTLFGSELERIELICRSRKDARLCLRSTEGGRRFFDRRKFTPEEVRKDESIPWQRGEFFHGGSFRDLRYKEVARVYWQGGAKRKPLRLIVIAPTPYRLHKKGRTYYRQEAYLLTTDLETDAAILVQAYLDHWQIEVNHREEKSNFGIGDAQVRNKLAVPRHPAFAVAIYAFLLLSALEAYGIERTEDYLPLPKWRKGAKRPSCADIIAQLRREMDQAGAKLVDFEPRSQHLTPATLRAAA